jgi:hypothetical protein
MHCYRRDGGERTVTVGVREEVESWDGKKNSEVQKEKE